MAREMLKFRKGESGLKIKNDGSIELAGVQDKALIDERGHMSPVILFAAAWAKKDQEVMQMLIKNFKSCVREGYFGDDAKNDFAAAEQLQKKAAASAAVTMSASGAVTQEPVSKTPEELKEEEEARRLRAIADQGQDPQVLKQQEAMKAGATSTTEKPYDGFEVPEGWTPEASGAVTTDTPTPMTTEEQLTRRDA